VGRYLRAGFPNASITFCDLDESGAEFCAREFKGTVQQSRPELSDVEFGQGFDVIWVGSLFTHVNLDRTGRWLKHLCSALTPDGVLIATFHGRWSIEVQKMVPMMDDNSWKEIVRAYQEDGFGFAPYQKHENYGVSLACPSKVVEIVEGIEGVRLLCYQERGWSGNHDVLGVAKTDRLESW